MATYLLPGTSPNHQAEPASSPSTSASASANIPSLFVVFYYANDILVEVEPFLVSEVKKKK